MKRQRHQAKPTSTPSKQLKLSNFFSTGSAPKTNEVIIIDSSSGEDEEEESAGNVNLKSKCGSIDQTTLEELPSEMARRLALADKKKPTATNPQNQNLVDIFWVLASATFKAEIENKGRKGASYQKAAKAFAAVSFVVTPNTVDIKKNKLAMVGKASVDKMRSFRVTGVIPKLVFYQEIMDGDSKEVEVVEVISMSNSVDSQMPTVSVSSSSRFLSLPKLFLSHSVSSS